MWHMVLVPCFSSARWLQSQKKNAFTVDLQAKWPYGQEPYSVCAHGVLIKAFGTKSNWWHQIKLIIKIWLFLVSSELLILSPPNLAWWHIIRSQSAFWENWIDTFKVKVTASLQNFNEFLSGRCCLNFWSFVIKLGVVMHHHELESHVKGCENMC